MIDMIIKPVIGIMPTQHTFATSACPLPVARENLQWALNGYFWFTDYGVLTPIGEFVSVTL